MGGSSLTVDCLTMRRRWHGSCCPEVEMGALTVRRCAAFRACVLLRHLTRGRGQGSSCS